MPTVRCVSLPALFICLLLPILLCRPCAAQKPLHDPELIAILQKATAAANASHIKEALQLYDQALEKARSLKDRVGEADTLSNISVVYYTLGQPKKALEYYDMALPLIKETGDKRGEAAALNNIGLLYDNLGQPPKALESYEKALPLMKEIGDRGQEAITLNNIGIVYDNLGQPQRALEYYEKALMLMKETGDRRSEATTFSNIGVTYSGLGQPRKALEYYEKVLPLLQKIGDKRQEATTLSNMGVEYDTLGQPQKALEYYDKALPLRKETGDKRGEAITLAGFGLVYSHLGQPQRALESYGKALPLMKETGDKRGEAITLAGFGRVYSRLGQPQKALEYYDMALPLIKETGDRRGEANMLNNIGVTHFRLGQPQKALEYYEKALPLAENVGDLNLVFYCRWDIGDVQQKQGQKEEAIVSYRKAIASLESVRGDLKKDEDRLILLEGGGKVRVYESLVQLLTERGKPEDLKEALTLLDRARSKQLLDSLRLDTLTVRDPKLRQLLAQTQALELQVAAQEKLRQNELNKPKEQQNPDRLTNFTRLVAGTKAEMRAVTNTIAENFPTDFARFVAIKPVDLKTLQQNLPPGALVVEYSPLETALLVFLVTHDTIRTVALPIPRQKAEGQVEAFRKEMERAGKQRSLPDNPPAGQEKLDLSHWDWNTPVARPLRDLVTSLYAELIAPLQGEFASASQVVIIPNGLLCYLPFPALAHELPDHTLRFFAEEKRLSVLPQLRLWNEIVDREAKRKPERGRLALFGNPDGSLPGAQTEAKAIGSLYANALLYLGADVTKEHLSSLPPDIGMAHLATHGILDSDDINNSYLMLAGGQKLKLTDLYGLTFPFHMAVLSACDTAMAHKNTGIEQTTLADAFVDAGSTTLVASLWPVSDASTAALMERFYRELKAGKSVSEALQVAEVSLLHTPATAHPYFWSPFTLLGDWR